MHMRSRATISPHGKRDVAQRGVPPASAGGFLSNGEEKGTQLFHELCSSDRHRQADGCGEIFLPEIEREEPFGFESDGGSGVEDIEAPVPTRQGVRG